MLSKLYLNNSRLVTDLGMIIFSLFGCYVASLYGSGTFNETVALGTGYVSLILLAVTLLIGPINLLRKRKNPVNINLRRDIGIWSGITALVHVVFSLQLTPGKSIFAYFTGDSVSGFGLFEAGNIVGLFATLIMVALLITSNQISLKLLKGKRWKLLQRFNYLLILLTVVHTVALQAANLRESFFFWGTLAVSLAVVAIQAFGIVTTISRSQERKNLYGEPAAATVKTGAATFTAPGQIAMARRRFLTVTGATLLGGVVVSGTAGYLLGRSQTGATTQADTGTRVLPNTPAPAQNPAQNQNPAQGQGQAGPFQGNPGFNRGGDDQEGGFGGNGGFERRGGRFGQGNNTGGLNGNGSAPSNNTAQPQPTAPATQGSASQPGGSNTQAANTTAASGASTDTNGRSVVLGNLSTVAVGAALEFTLPNTNEPAFVIHEQDGSVKAFSGLCTHRPYKLVYDTASKELVCNLHDVPFNIITGAPTRSPARSALTSYKVHVDSQNNIVYDIS